MVIVEDLHRRRHHQVCGCRPPSEFTTTNTTAKAIAISVLLQVVTAGGRLWATLYRWSWVVVIFGDYGGMGGCHHWLVVSTLFIEPATVSCVATLIRRGNRRMLLAWLGEFHWTRSHCCRLFNRAQKLFFLAFTSYFLALGDGRFGNEEEVREQIRLLMLVVRVRRRNLFLNLGYILVLVEHMVVAFVLHSGVRCGLWLHLN